MLTFTAACVTVFTVVPDYKMALAKVDWIIYPAGIVGIILMLIIVVGKKWSRKSPQNYILLCSFTLFWSLMVTCLTAYFKP